MKRLSTSVAAASFVSVRTYVEAPIGVSNRMSQPYMTGDKLPASVNYNVIPATAGALSETGSNFNASFDDMDALFSVKRMAKDTNFFTNRYNAKYAVPPMTKEHAEIAAGVVAEFRANEVAVASFFKRIIKDFPATVYILGTPEEITAFDENEARKTPYNKLIVGRLNRDAGAVNIREDLLTFYSDIFAVLSDTELATKVATPVVERFRHDSFVTQYLWWEFKAALLTELKELPLMNNYKTRLTILALSLIHISEPTRLLSISYAVFCLKKKKKPILINSIDNEKTHL
eukprot:TRINITY_DN19683_c0_g1_i3.p1 TRINITY_DN19683_c0_g1~~TRINITY_DN19683_c0_g1_i3.p1  ORF type:complete len:288 (-),score=100.73 TRINITY_DN19683_c0_g1_i3:73-936(-)